MALALVLGSPGLAAAQDPPYGVDCPMPTSLTADPGTFEHRWAGLVHDAFTLDGEEIWTGEDGGSIRHRPDATSDWSFQPTPYQVRGTIRRLHFLSNGLDGWAISSDGYVLRTIDGGDQWTGLARIPALRASYLYFGMDWEDLYDVWFMENGTDGWLVTLHGIFYTTNGGTCWEEAPLFDKAGVLLQPVWVRDEFVELYSIDVKTGAAQDTCSGPSDPSDFLALVSGQNGFVLRSLDGTSFQIVLDAADVCAMVDPALDPCLDVPCPSSHNKWFELWDLEISNHSTEDLVLIVGGINTKCGLILASTDNGCTWQREFHECSGVIPGLDCSTLPEFDETLPPYHWDRFKTLYGVDIFDLDNTAVAAGYNGQHIRRELLGDGTPVWRDRSRMAPIEDVEGADPPVIYPLVGVVAHDGQDGATGVAWTTGVGGHIRRTSNGGVDWSPEVLGQPFRINDVWFKSNSPPSPSSDLGWQVGQFFRLARTEDGGRTWVPGEPDRLWGAGSALQDASFAGDGLHGVTVGGPIPGDTSMAPSEWPRILATDNFGSAPWFPPSDVTYSSLPEEEVHRETTLRAACWAKDTSNLEFWAVGGQGLVLRTATGGVTWEQVPIPTSLVSNPHTLTLHGVAASSPNSIIVVGSRAGLARAFSYLNSSWAEIPIPTSPSGPIEVLTDVAAQGSSIYAVGHRDWTLEGKRTGVVLKVGFPPAADPPAFVEFDGPQYPNEIEDCGIAGLGVKDQVLTSIEITSAGDVWIAGTCGMAWQFVGMESAWSEHKTQTNADIRGMSFTAPDNGYFAAKGGEQTGQVVIHYHEQ